MTANDLSESRIRFNVIARFSEQCDHMDGLFDSLQELNFKLGSDHTIRLADNVSKLTDNLNSNILSGHSYHELRKHVPDLEDIITIPRKLSEFVNDSNHHDEALGLFEVIDQLSGQHSNEAPVLREIQQQARMHHDQLVNNLCYQLDSLKDASQEDLLVSVNRLVRSGGFSGRDLRLRFLQARDLWFNTECESRENSFDDLTSFICRGLPKIFDEYRTIFSETTTHSNLNLMMLPRDSRTKDDGAIINSWLLLKVCTFILSLEMHFERLEKSRSLTPSMLSDTMEKCFKLTDWLTSIGFDFSSRLKPIFAKSVIEEVRFSVKAATEKFETNFTRLIGKSIESLLLPIDDVILRISSMRPEDQLPKSIDHYPVFKVYCLEIINSMRWVQATKSMLSTLSMCLDVYSSLNASLTRVMKALAVVLNIDNNTNHPILSKIAVSFLTETVPYIANYCETIFPERAILNALGLSRQEFKQLCSSDPERTKNLRLDLKLIGQPIRGTMPALMQAIEG